MRFERVLVAVDGSEFAAHALEVASSLATAVSAQLGLVHVIDVKLVSGEAGIPADRQWAAFRADGQALLDTAGAAIAAHPWKFLREGTPWKEIVQSAREWPADLIVIGTHGRSGVTRLVFGSTAEGVARHASVPVVVVPPASRSGEDG
jgi:nucleotide-binding universal stress UspA family protein